MPNDEEIPGYGYNGIDPTDLAMFAGARTALPLSAMLYSKELNSGPDAERFARQKAYEMAVAERQRDEQIRRAIALREKQQLDARIPVAAQNWYINRNYDPNTATRRVDYERPPARNFGSPGTEMRAMPPRFQKGGKVVKTLQQMADELLARGTRTAVADTPDIGRRALFGLRPQQDFPLANIHPDIAKATESRLTKALKDAPQVTEKSTEINPATGSIKSTLQSVAGTPLSRRTVLSATAGQALRHMIPGLDDLAPGVGDIAKVADTVVKAAAPAAMTADMIPGFMLSAMKAGASKDDALKMVMDRFKLQRPYADSDRFIMSPDNPVMDPLTGKPSAYPFQLDTLYDTLRDPLFASGEKEFIEPLRPTDALKNLLSSSNIDFDTPPMKLRGALRSMKEADPDRYRGLIEHARDYSLSTGETAIENGMMTPRNLERYMKGVDAEPKYRPERYWNE
jgi:hypothetical protein